jgi:N-acyl-D-amino-acid deacylase
MAYRELSRMHASLPKWVHTGNPAILDRLRDPNTRRRIETQMDAVDCSRIVQSSVSRPKSRRFVGSSVADAAHAAGKLSGFDFYCDLLIEEELGVGATNFIGNEENVRTVLQHSAHMAGSDGIVVGDRPHPRAWHVRSLPPCVRA